MQLNNLKSYLYWFLKSLVLGKIIMDKRLNLTAVFEKAEEGGYIAYIEEIPGVNTQGETISEAKENLYEALQMVLDVNREISQKDSLNKEVIKESFNFIY